MGELVGFPALRGGRAPVRAADTAPGRQRWWPIGIAVVALCAAPVLILGTRIDSWAGGALESAAAPGVAGLVMGLLALDTVLPVPSSVVATVAGLRLGFPGASAAIWVGLCLGNGLGYLIGRIAGGPVVRQVVGPDQLSWAASRVGSRPGTTALVATRPVPILSEATVVLAGAVRAPVARTATVCGLANLGLAIVYAGLGSAAHGPFAIPLGLAGAAGIPAVAVAASALLRVPRREASGGVEASDGTAA